MSSNSGGGNRQAGIGIALAFTAIAAITLGQTTAWTPELSMKVKTVADVVPSPDGHYLAWVETRAVMDTEVSEMRSDIFLGNANGSHRIQLTHSEKGSTAPAFTPDSRWVVFVSETGGKKNLCRIPVDGGESEPLTHWTGTLGTFQISPDGRWIAFTGREADTGDEQAKREKLDLRVIGGNPKDQSLWLVRIESEDPGNPRKLRKLAEGPYTIGSFDWAPDGRRIAFEARPTPDANDARLTDLYEVEVESGAIRPIANTAATESEPHYSPDGRYLAYLRNGDPPSILCGSRIVLLTRSDSKTRDLQATYDESPALVAWSADSKQIYFTEGRHTRAILYSMPIDGPPAAVFAPKRGTIGHGVRFNRATTLAGLVMESLSEPVEAYALELSTGTAVRVSMANTDLPRAPLGETRVIHWKSKDGKEMEGLLTLPVGYRQGRKYPLILNIHGGPAGAFNETFIGARGPYPVAAFAAKGYAVLRCNPRGSSGYGLEFRAADLNDWGGGDYQDLMTGVDSVVSSGVADPNRLAVMGWSYGGYMTNWVITQTTRFKAAATGAGLSDLVSMWGTNDIPGVLDDYLSGPSYKETDRYVKMSPLYYVDKVKTPTLILHGEADVRVPTSQGYEMYHALKRRDVPAMMVVYPRQPHGVQEPKFVLDIMHRHLDWIAKYIGATE